MMRPLTKRRLLAAMCVALACFGVTFALFQRQLSRRRAFEAQASTVGAIYRSPLPEAWDNQVSRIPGTLSRSAIDAIGRPAILMSSVTVHDDDLRLAASYTHAWEELLFVNSSLENHQLRLLSECRRVFSINVARTKLDSGAIATLQSFERLKYLVVDDLPLFDADIAKLAELPHLEAISTNGCPIGRHVVNALSKAQSLQRWYAMECPDLVLTPDDCVVLGHLEKITVNEESVPDLADCRERVSRSGGRLRIVVDSLGMVTGSEDQPSDGDAF